MRFDLLSIFILVSVAQGLFVGFMLFRTNPVSKYSRLFLCLIILGLTWYQLEFLLIRSKMELNYYLIYGTRYGSWLLIGPLLWLYTKTFFSRQFKFSSKTLLHFLPFAIVTLVIPLFNKDLLTWRSFDYGMLTVFDNWNRKPITTFQYIYGSVFLMQFLHALFYVLMSFRFIKQTENELRQQYSDFDQVSIRWHLTFQRTATLVLVLVTLFILYQYITGDYRRMADYFYVVPMSAVSYLLLYHAIKYPNLIFGNSLPEKTYKYEKSSLAISASVEYAEKLRALIESRKLYLERELGLSDLANEMGVSTHHLSQAINEILNLNFYDLINQYRVEEAKSRIKEEKEKSLLQVAFEVGFNNKASFNNAFKKHVGMTPSKYRESA
ncbi:MAG: helix-turn-helix domain-containing protein [Cyclobacteriaceae bacterium]